MQVLGINNIAWYVKSLNHNNKRKKLLKAFVSPLLLFTREKQKWVSDLRLGSCRSSLWENNHLNRISHFFFGSFDGSPWRNLSCASTENRFESERNVIVNSMYERYCAVITVSNTLGTNNFPLAPNDRFSVSPQVDSSFKHSIAMFGRWKSQGRIQSRIFSAHIVRLPRLFSIYAPNVLRAIIEGG